MGFGLVSFGRVTVDSSGFGKRFIPASVEAKKVIYSISNVKNYRAKCWIADIELHGFSPIAPDGFCTFMGTMASVALRGWGAVGCAYPSWQSESATYSGLGLGTDISDRRDGGA